MADLPLKNEIVVLLREGSPAQTTRAVSVSEDIIALEWTEKRFVDAEKVRWSFQRGRWEFNATTSTTTRKRRKTAT